MSTFHSRRTHLAIASFALALAAGCQSIQSITPSWLRFGKQPQPAAYAPPVEKPLKLDAQQTADVRISMARSLENEGQLSDAARIYQEVIRADKRRWFRPSPQRAEAYYRLAVLNDKRSEFGKAEECYLEAIKLDPENPNLHCDLGYSYYLQHRWTEAESSLVRALELRPEFPRAHNNLALVLANTGRLEQAHRAFVNAGCTPAEAHSNLAYAFLLEQKWTEAQRHFDLALAADPTTKPAQQGMATLQSIAGKADNVQHAFAPDAAGLQDRITPLPEAQQVQFRQ